jgi:membrane-bound metal-dependent hydrolase YbcI (DUF457 family)
MNGKTHQISGVAATLAATYLAVKGSAWVAATLPDWAAAILQPPAALLNAAGGPGPGGSTSATVPASTGTVLVGGGPAATITAGAASFGSVSSLDLGALMDKTGQGPALGAGFSEAGLSNIASAGVNLASVALLLAGIALLGLIAGQFPDIDTPDSTIANSGRAVGRLVGGRGVFGLVVRGLFWLVNLLPHTTAVIANKFFGHRGGIIHGLVGLCGTSLLVGALCAYFFHAPFVGVLFFSGYFTHLVVDSFSKSGVKWFWPLTAKSFHILPPGLRFDTGNWWHNALAQLAAGGLIVWVGFGFFGLLF